MRAKGKAFAYAAGWLSRNLLSSSAVGAAWNEKLGEIEAVKHPASSLDANAIRVT